MFQEYACIRVGNNFKIPKTKLQTGCVSLSKTSSLIHSGGWLKAGPRQRIGPTSRRKSMPVKISHPKETSPENRSQNMALEGIKEYTSDEGADDRKCGRNEIFHASLLLAMKQTYKVAC